MTAPKGRSLAIALSVVVVLAIGAGLYVTGSPGTAREQALDRRRASDLRDIAAKVKQYHERHGAFPPSLAAMQANVITRTSRDPVTGQPYEFEVVSDSSFLVCARFSLPSVPGREGEDDAHPAGRYCFPGRIGAITK